MAWNWQQSDWPKFSWDESQLAGAEREFLLRSAECAGAIRHLSRDDREQLSVEAMSSEAVMTSEIEGEILDRASVVSSIRRQLGLSTDSYRLPPAERGVAEVMVDLNQSFAFPLTEDMLFRWHHLLLSFRNDLKDIGFYRTHDEPMQIVSRGRTYDFPTVHFEAPPSELVPREMKAFVDWFNQTAPESSQALPAITRAGLTHLYFESIHPFEDGNGRLGRALSEKAINQTMGHITYVALATAIAANRKTYYQSLEEASKSNEVTSWLVWFGSVVNEAQTSSTDLVDFLIAKTKMFNALRGQLNQRQEKALIRMFAEGRRGFKGGLSAGNYMKISGAPSTTATRDLADLVEKGALTKSGELRHTRYFLKLHD